MPPRGLGALGPLTQPPNSPTPSNGSNLPSALSDLESFENLVAQTHDRLLQFRKLNRNDDTVTLLQTALEYLPKAGRINLMHDITSCDDMDVKQLRDHFVDAILKPMKATGGETPAITASPSKSATVLVETQKGLMLPPDSSSEPSKMKANCLERDDHRCAITNYVDSIWNHDHSDLYPQETITNHTECAHILPHALGNIDLDRAQEVENAAIIWAALYRYFPALVGEIAPDTINSNANGITLFVALHKCFGQFMVYFERMEQPNTYRLVWTENNIVKTLCPPVITFSAKDPSIPVPNPHFLQVHCVVAKILRELQYNI
ncbi:hypothetical protein V493_00984 [Pseudogymnoascus sp. VKM F-4281 (FW-2241)]|nr:hypothetical protein V493_00984 [Pseudogymnoascus sp. VKM F-4281 (FW-2241)]